MDVISIVSLIVGLLLLAFQLVILFKLQRLKRDLSRTRKDRNSHPREDDSGRYIRELTSEVRKLQSQVVRITEDLASMLDVDMLPPAVETRKSVNEGGGDDRTSHGSHDILYFASASTDGVVDDSNCSKEESPDTLYWMEILKDGEARIRHFVNQKAWENALQSPELYIMPVCSFRGSPTSSSQISMVNEGAAKLESGRWRIIRKIEIKLS